MSYPIDDLLTVCRWRRAAFGLQVRQEIATLAGGEVIGRDLGPELWVGAWESVPVTLAQARGVRAKLDRLRGVVGSFIAWDLDAATPQDYPAGSGFGTPTMLQVGVGGTRLRLQGLTVGATLRAGDLLSFTAPDGGRALHRLLFGATADGDGNIPFTDVRPAVRDGPGEGAAVSLAPASCVMRLVPGSVEERAETPFTRVFSFQGVQVVSP